MHRNHRYGYFLASAAAVIWMTAGCAEQTGPVNTEPPTELTAAAESIVEESTASAGTSQAAPETTPAEAEKPTEPETTPAETENSTEPESEGREDEEETMPEGYFSNEQFKDLKIADPFVLKASDGMYYLYGTTGGKGFSCMRSENLIEWTDRRACFTAVGSGWCSASGTFWAPEVVEYEGKYYMFYTSKNSEGSLRIGVAVSDEPTGWFRNLKDEPLFDFGYACIDANVLIDDDGRKYLYYARDCSENTVNGKRTSQIYGVELEDDFSGVRGEAVLLLTPEQPWEMISENPWWNEGPEMLKHDGTYYLSYSANLYSTSAYSVGYAVSDSPLGPFVKAEENPILTSVVNGKRRSDVSGTGHHSFTVSPDGTELWAAYHSHIDPSNPKLGRRFNLDRAGFTEDGKLYIEGPTTEPQPVPSGAEIK